MDYNWLDEIGNDDYSSLPIIEENRELPEWEVSRLGMITGSNFGKLVVLSKDRKSYTLSSGQTAENLIYKIAWERLLRQGNISNGLGRLNVSSKEMAHGVDYEPIAIQKYEQATGNKVKYSQEFVKLNEWVGGTPDGFIGDDGLIEAKCPWNGGLHLKSLLNQEIYNPDYIYQVHGYLWITGRKWCDFVTFDPDLIDELQLNIIRVERDEAIIEGISMVMDLVKEKIQQIISKIETKN